MPTGCIFLESGLYLDIIPRFLNMYLQQLSVKRVRDCSVRLYQKCSVGFLMVIFLICDLKPILHGLGSMRFYMAHGYHHHPLLVMCLYDFLLRMCSDTVAQLF